MLKFIDCSHFGWDKKISLDCLDCSGAYVKRFIFQGEGSVHRTAESSFKVKAPVALLYYALWLVSKTRATFSSTNEKQKQNQSWFARTRFPALGACYLYLRWILIGSLRCLRLLWLIRVITLVLVLRHSLENRSKQMLKAWGRPVQISCLAMLLGTGTDCAGRCSNVTLRCALMGRFFHLCGGKNFYENV